MAEIGDQVIFRKTLKSGVVRDYSNRSFPKILAKKGDTGRIIATENDGFCWIYNYRTKQCSCVAIGDFEPLD